MNDAIPGNRRKFCFEIERNLSPFSSSLIFSHLSFFIFIRRRIWLRESCGWLANLLFQCNSIHHTSSILPFLSLLALVYPGRFVHIPSISEHSHPFLRFPFPACLSQLPRRLSGCFSATCTPGRCSTGKKDEFITRDTDENIKQTAPSYNLFLPTSSTFFFVLLLSPPFSL